MEWVETTGKTIEEAKEAALDELGVDEQDAEFEVLEEPKVGLFGRLRSEGRIRARVRPTTPRAKEDRRDRRRRPKGGGDSATAAPSSTAPDSGPPPTSTRAPRTPRSRSVTAAEEATPVRAAAGDTGTDTSDAGPGRPRTNPSRRRGRGALRPDATVPTASDDAASSPAAAEAPAAATGVDPDATMGQPAAGGPDQTGGRPASARSRSRKRSSPNRSPAPSQDDGIDAGEGTLMDVALDEQGKVAEQFLIGLLDSFGLPARVAVTVPDDDTIDIQVTGDDLGLLIGPKGSTLLSIQDLTRTVVQRKTSAGNGRIFIDISNYRQKRNEALTRFAQKVAADVLASGTRLAMEPMSAPDRKTVHDAITEIDGVETLSEGEDAERHVIVIPVGD